ncbi:SIR2 family NAD-dependent protein deacylase [Microbaculum marinisediminis]|uniref:protein acetyllysine N-acetyltransferase n=1 Tax=Microbaculum marinisediminis TaxID=2931392 RepID=A0AAW5R389_9HYPH|nr:Sir2 family NAD-dependent protein deacetylase [Microbaculum sp. A6E488]MCT8973108.1 Sir2 family NAD-dependent protein deacetylase [Microbaculum sp. A6E488]
MGLMDDLEPPARALIRMVRDAERVVVFTGAGISTECGIPDFRSPGGLWTKYRPIEFQDYMSSAQMRAEAWRRKFAMEPAFRAARPGRGHNAIAHLVRIGKVRNVITQNIDNLHQMSGVPENRVIELHGNATYAHCLDCGLRHEIDDIRMAFEATGEAPGCRACGGIVKTATVSFGQAMPQEEMLRAEAATEDCDLFLAIGSSLVVYPAAGFPLMAKRNGARLVILNREATDLDPYADLVVSDDIGSVLEPLSTLNN